MRSGGLWPKLLACVIFLLCGTGARAVPLETAATPGRAQLPYQTGRPRCSGQSHVHGRIITANVSDAKQMVDYLAVADATVLAVQEHRTGADQLADVQARARDKGWSGAWIPGVATEAGGTSGGLAILTRGKAMITVPPGKDSHVLVDGRAMAARVHWGCPGGLVFVNLYLVVGEGPSECNCSILHDVALYLAEVNSRGFDWIVCGDFNMEYDSLPDLEWLRNLGGVAMRPRSTTCRQSTPGSCIDYFLVSANVVTRLQAPTTIEDAATFPHVPVLLPLLGKDNPMLVRELAEPKAVQKGPQVGCSRFPGSWDVPLAAVRRARDGHAANCLGPGAERDGGRAVCQVRQSRHLRQSFSRPRWTCEPSVEAAAAPGTTPAH